MSISSISTSLLEQAIKKIILKKQTQMDANQISGYYTVEYIQYLLYDIYIGLIQNNIYFNQI